jgi:hypothetical protein
MVNSFPLEEIGANTTPSVTLKNNERDETARMIEHIMLLENRLKDEPKTYTNFLNGFSLIRTRMVFTLL